MLSAHLLGSALESAPDAIVVTDTHSGQILFANRRVRAIFGYEPEELLGQTIERLMPERFALRHERHRQSYIQNLRTRPMGAGLELFAQRKDGSEFPVEISLSPIQDHRGAWVAAAIRDVTERKKAQAIDAMSRLLNALLDISKLESGAIKPEPEDFMVASLLEDLRAEFAALASQKGLKLCVEAESLSVHADPGLVGQMLRNLLANAIKYTHQGAIFLRSIPKIASVRIEVLDTGIGIPADQLPFIYDEFFQVGVASHATREGHGLGLSIVARLANLLGVELEVHSKEKAGSCFAFELPRVTAAIPNQHSDAGASPVHTARAAYRHILLVDDDAAVCEAMESFLSVTGYRVSSAYSLADAVREVRENPDVALVITDYHLGDTETGSQIITAVREIRGANLPVVLMTGDTSRAIRELPQDEHLRIASKPIKVKELLRLIQELIP